MARTVFGMLVLLAWAGQVVRAENAVTGADETDPAAVVLELQPSVCLLASGEELCRDRIDVSWRAGDRRSACLFQRQIQAGSLQCWQDVTSGSAQVAVATADKLRFELRSSPGDTLLASGELTVARLVEHTRARRRNPWSFF